MQIECKTIQGASNYHKSRENQDAYSIESSKGITSVCVCDGASFSKYGAAAAKKVAQTVSHFMIDYYDKWDPDKMRDKVIKCVNRELSKLSSKCDICYKDLATTIMGICVKEGGKINMLHLGDGNILVKKKNDELLYFLSSAQNGIFKNQTYLTGDADLMKHLRVYSPFYNPEYEEIYMITDGGNDYMNNDRSITVQAARLLFSDDKIALNDDCTSIRINL